MILKINKEAVMFSMQLKIHQDLKIEFPQLYKEPSYSEEDNNVGSIINDICDILQEIKVADFIVSGFGDSKWPVDVRTDLSVILSQVSEVLEAINSSNDFDLDFFEQGVERYLSFTDKGNTFLVTCRSFTSRWEPKPNQISLDKRVFTKMIIDLKIEFCHAAKTICPKLSSHPWFFNWCRFDKQVIN
jgi:hypothetical protein